MTTSAAHELAPSVPALWDAVARQVADDGAGWRTCSAPLAELVCCSPRR